MPSFLHILLVLWGALSGVASAQGAEHGVYRIGPGDTLEIEVHGETFGGKHKVGPDGTFSFPYIDRMHVAGLTIQEAEDELEGALKDGVLNFPQVSIGVANYGSRPVEVLGAVGKPGTYHLDGPTYLRSMIARAGGIDTEKSSRQVRITRKDGEEILVGLAELPGEAGAIQLEAGDVVTVDQGVFIFISGEVKNPGAVSWSDGMTVTEALTIAGGETGIARLRGAYVLREDEKIRVNIRRIRNNKSANLTLQPGDQLVVPESPL